MRFDSKLESVETLKQANSRALGVSKMVARSGVATVRLADPKDQNGPLGPKWTVVHVSLTNAKFQTSFCLDHRYCPPSSTSATPCFIGRDSIRD